MEVSASGRTVPSNPHLQQWSSHLRNLHWRYSAACDGCRQRHHMLQHGRGGRLTAVAEASRLAVEFDTASLCNQHVREGYSESRLVHEQVSLPYRADRADLLSTCGNGILLDAVDAFTCISCALDSMYSPTGEQGGLRATIHRRGAPAL
jgi:hypothetical protein